MPEKRTEKYGRIYSIENPEPETLTRAIQTMPLVPAQAGYIALNARGVPSPNIIDDYGAYLKICRENNLIPIELHCNYDARAKSFSDDDSVFRVSPLAPDCCIGKNADLFRSQFLEHLAREGQIHSMSFYIDKDSMEEGLDAFRKKVMGALSSKGYVISKCNLDFAIPEKGWNDRLILNFRSPDEGLSLELSDKLLLPEQYKTLRNWFKNL